MLALCYQGTKIPIPGSLELSTFWSFSFRFSYSQKVDDELRNQKTILWAFWISNNSHEKEWVLSTHCPQLWDLRNPSAVTKVL